jgi:hypothetical protein
VGALLALVAIGTIGAHSTHAAQKLPAAGSPFDVGTFVWRFNEDYPGTKADTEVPLKNVYIKTNDGDNWMAKWDKNPAAVSGPDSLKALIQDYKSKGITTTAWFVPKGNDYAGQLEIAEQVIDSGVDALYADVEPYGGFCNKDCGALAENLWKPLRAARPNATLGVVYDPRPNPRLASDVTAWLSVANVGSPMCYWDDFVGQSPWNTPDGCVGQAAADLPILAGNNTSITMIPAVPGQTDAAKIQTAISTVLSLGGYRMSLWRRGVVTPEVWGAIAAAQPNPVRDLHDRLRTQILELSGKSPFSFPAANQLLQLLDQSLKVAHGG